VTNNNSPMLQETCWFVKNSPKRDSARAPNPVTRLSPMVATTSMSCGRSLCTDLGDDPTELLLDRRHGNDLPLGTTSWSLEPPPTPSSVSSLSDCGHKCEMWFKKIGRSNNHFKALRKRSAVSVQ
jgi:hypothetical protein